MYDTACICCRRINCKQSRIYWIPCHCERRCWWGYSIQAESGTPSDTSVSHLQPHAIGLVSRASICEGAGAQTVMASVVLFGTYEYPNNGTPDLRPRMSGHPSHVHSAGGVQRILPRKVPAAQHRTEALRGAGSARTHAFGGACSRCQRALRDGEGVAHAPLKSQEARSARTSRTGRSVLPSAHASASGGASQGEPVFSLGSMRRGCRTGERRYCGAHGEVANVEGKQRS